MKGGEIMKKLFIGVFAVALSLIATVPAFAHVVVKPNEAGVATFQTFTMGVPNEKEAPTIALRLVIPQGIAHVSPNVKPGWKIEIKKEGEGESAKITEIAWTGGSIPVGQRDEFVFSAQVPAEESTLIWKAYQTYQDGSVVSWDQDAAHTKDMSDTQKEHQEEEGKGPYSTTKVVNDVVSTAEPAREHTQSTSSVLSFAAIALAVTSIVMQLRKK